MFNSTNASVVKGGVFALTLFLAGCSGGSGGDGSEAGQDATGNAQEQTNEEGADGSSPGNDAGSGSEQTETGSDTDGTADSESGSDSGSGGGFFDGGGDGASGDDQSSGSDDDSTSTDEESGENSVEDDVDASGWPKPLKENNKPYENTTEKVVASYFVEWGVYDRDYHVADMPAENLTHVLYGFIPICGPNESLQAANPSGYSALQSQCQGKQDYEVVIHDKYAALEKSYPEDEWDDPIKGNFGQLQRLSKARPDLKILPSVGGWTLSDPFFSMAQDPAKRKIFVDSMIDFIKKYDFFDGIDIDWEFPGGRGANPDLGGPEDAEAYTILMRELRSALDDLEAEKGREYELTSAVGTSPEKIASVNYENAQKYMDYVFAMTYDFYGSWSAELGHQAGLYEAQNAVHEDFYGHSAIQALMNAGVPANKLVLGVAMYGRGWNGIESGTVNNPFAGGDVATGDVGPIDGTWEDGVLDYRDIEDNMLGGMNGEGINGFEYFYDEIAEAPYLWNYQTGELVTYENARSTKAKMNYVQQNNLAGAFSWEIDADNGVILNAIHEGLGHPSSQ